MTHVMLCAVMQYVGEAAAAEVEGEAVAVKKYYIGSDQLESRRKDMDVTAAMAGGLISNWDAVERLWSHVMLMGVGVDPRQHPVLLSEPVHTTAELREKTATAMFEGHRVPACFLAKNAVLTAYACGRSTALVFKSGGARTVAVPVVEGWAMAPQALSLDVGGEQLSTALLEQLSGAGQTPLRPRSTVMTSASGEVVDFDIESFRPSYREFWLHDLAHAIKASGCIRFGAAAAGAAAGGAGADADAPPKSFELPDGKKLDVGPEYSARLGSMCFAASESDGDAMDTDEGQGGAAASSEGGAYAQLITEAIKGAKLNVEVSKELYGSVIVSGGNTLFPGFVDQLHNETYARLKAVSPALSAKLRMVVSESARQRHYATWIGGSIVASLSSFAQLWVTEEEYHETGPGIVHGKCP
eukprot:COSAG01_NODE_375_length_17945_cov_175.968284_11_plen_413_part_00